MFSAKLLMFSSAVLVMSMVEAEESNNEVSRVKRQSNLLPPNFQCKFCDKCDKPCKSTCALCTGCKLARRLGFSLKNIEECRKFCRGGVNRCVQICENSKSDCQYCQYC
eukprot:TRINITY_DN3028_c0_g2_i1.p1 TRINITY_DN3028_c0_g2~~TRINITY_DN3028_c0_g2_i1.p1  ORF type:complete len:109 (-),score=13.17 TRINITY_DN3028_c0_g2_i1:31-357(-)